MHLYMFAFYGGPDQVMTVTSALASGLGLLLIFWNKVVATFFKVVGVFRKKDASPAVPPQVKPPNTAR